MKISEVKIKQLIKEEKEKLLIEQKVPGAQFALKEIALQSAQLHDAPSLVKINEKDLIKIKYLAETLDDIFYRVMNG